MTTSATPPAGTRAASQAPSCLASGSLTFDWRSVRSLANAMTLTRTVVSMTCGSLAIVERSVTLLVVAYALYWVGDVLDGWLARKFDQETRAGAVFDIVADRGCSSLLVAGLMTVQPQLWPALLVYALQFLVIDCMLSVSFLHWNLVSPNYFYRVHRDIWWLNWSPPAKAANTAAVVLSVLTGLLPLAMAVACAQLALKAWSSIRVLCLMSETQAPAVGT